MDDRDEAIDILTRMSTNYFYGHREQEAFKLGAEALSAERRETQSSECEYWDSESNFCALYRPSAERRGRWIESDVKNEKYVCSVCGGACWYYDYEGEVAKSNFCPNCGAEMEIE